MPLLFPASVFLSAALLFLVEPMFARMVLPKLGGAPAVWNTCVAFYQVLLLGGYAYAHTVARRLTVKTQIVVHLTLMLAAALWLPMAIPDSWLPGAAEHPSLTVIRWLILGLGLPFFVLSGSGPLLQHWYALAHGAASNPYRLYAASNAGSLLALLAYPAAIEPLLRLRAQSVFWAVGYGAFLLAAAACGAAAWTARPTAAAHETADRDRRGVAWSSRLLWLALAFVPSSLMLSVTTFVSTDIAAIPLLWVVPLALYLITLIIAFADSTAGASARTIDVAFAASIFLIVALVIADNTVPVRAAIPAHMVAFVVAAWACHQRLASLRPDVTRLTEFYLWMSAGGAAGGAFNTFVAPVLFKTPLEYPIVAIVASALFAGARPGTASVGGRAWTWAAPLLPALVVLISTPLSYRLGWDWLPESTPVRAVWATVPALAVAATFLARPFRLGIALALVMIAGAWVKVEDRVTLHTTRTFFGTHRVTDTGFTRVLLSGTTNHGSQAVEGRLVCEPLSYYSRGGPIGQLFGRLHTQSPALRIGVVGLGTAAMATYTRPSDSLTFFEINPIVEDIARNPRYFTYLRDCAPQSTVVLGDARLSLEQVPDAAYDVLMVDAFSSDAIPVHLMTTEAVALYFRKLTPQGLLVLHISNRYLDLTPVIASIARSQDLTAVHQEYRPGASAERWRDVASHWVVVSRTKSSLLPLVGPERYRELAVASGPLWTDDYSNVVRIIKR